MSYVLIWAVVTVLSVLLGWTSGWLAGRQRGAGALTPVEIDAESERRIRDAAWRWATARGRPWLAPLIADKLRLAYRLRDRADTRRDQEL